MDLCTWEALTAAVAAQGPVASSFLSVFSYMNENMCVMYYMTSSRQSLPALQLEM